MKRFLMSFTFAVNGIRAAFISQRNVRIHSAATLLAVAAGFFFTISATEWCQVILAVGLVWAAELFNTSVEGLVDLLEPGKRHLAGRIKDIAAGGVLMAALCAAAVGALVFLKYLMV